jgi:regulator of nucleoside diphosphate kinase
MAKKTLKKKQKQATRKQQEVAKRQVDILEIAENVFQREGFAAAKAEVIAQEAQISVGTIYNIFGSKEKLFAQVIENIGDDLISQIEVINKKYGPAKAFEKIIALRLTDYSRYGLFLMPFSLGYAYNNFNLNMALDKQRGIYYKYLDQISKIIEKGIDTGVFEPVNSFAAAIGFEGLLNAFVNYWLDPHKSSAQATDLSEVKKTILDVLRLRGENKDFVHKGEQVQVPIREVFITKYDYLRLKELIDVARMFDAGAFQESLDRLNTALDRSKIVNSEEVPSDVITMNSKLKLVNKNTGETNIVQLVFPSDTSKSENALSILTPLGTVLLGQWKSGVVELDNNGQMESYLIEEILYQPESSGDYHL